MRRRRIVRPGMRPGMRPVNNRPVHPLLRKANQLFANGQYAEAAELFIRLGEGALARNIPRAPHLFLQAGKAYLHADDSKAAIEKSQYGLSLFAKDERWGELKRFGDRVISSLKEHKLEAEAKELQAWLDSAIPEGVEIPDMPIRMGSIKKDVHLPLSCPSCGGAVNPKEVDWVDDITAECSFCGNMLRGE